MSVLFEQAEEYVHEIARDIIAKYHVELQDRPNNPGSGTRLCILMASQEDRESEEPAVKLHGYPCAAVISIINYKQRVDKRADAEIILDKAKWEEATDQKRRARLDHQITHLKVQRDENNYVKTDDLGRPKLEMRLHDFVVEGFRSIAQRYGSDAPEVEAARMFEQEFGQVCLGKGELFPV